MGEKPAHVRISVYTHHMKNICLSRAWLSYVFSITQRQLNQAIQWYYHYGQHDVPSESLSHSRRNGYTKR